MLFIFFILLLLNQYSRLNAGEQGHCEPIDGDVIEVNRKFANKQTSRMAFLLASPVVITMQDPANYLNFRINLMGLTRPAHRP
jgi:hypothetical protein